MKRVQFCCGGNRIPGWENYDTDCDVTKPLPFADATYDAVLCEHGGEHFPSPVLLRFLDECRRILRPGGKLRLVCPVVGPWLTREHARDLALNHGHCIVLTEEVMRTFLWMAGFDQQRIRRVDRNEWDQHWRVIGADKDAIESCRMEAVR